MAKDRLKSTRGRAAYSFWWGYGISHAAPQDKPERSVHWVRREGGREGRERGGRGGRLKHERWWGDAREEGGTRVAR